MSIPIQTYSGLFIYLFSHLQIPLPKKKKKSCRSLTEQMHVLCLLWQLDSLKELCPKKKERNVKAFILEMKRMIVPLVNVLNTISKLYALEKVDLLYQCIDFLSFFPLFFSFHVVFCSAALMYR